ERLAKPIAALARSVTANADNRSPSPVNDRAETALSDPPSDVQTVLAILIAVAFTLIPCQSKPRRSMSAHRPYRGLLQADHVRLGSQAAVAPSSELGLLFGHKQTTCGPVSRSTHDPKPSLWCCRSV